MEAIVLLMYYEKIRLTRKDSNGGQIQEQLKTRGEKENPNLRWIDSRKEATVFSLQDRNMAIDD